MLQRIYIKKDSKRLSFDVLRCEGLSKVLGLMFKKRNDAVPLLFDFSDNLFIHSFFVTFPFLAIWLDEDEIIKTEMVNPFTFMVRSPKGSNRLIEMPIADNYDRILVDITS